MDKACKVDFIETLEYKGALKGFKQTDELDLAKEMESLITERIAQGYQLFQVVQSKKISSIDYCSGYFLFFLKK